MRKIVILLASWVLIVSTSQARVVKGVGIKTGFSMAHQNFVAAQSQLNNDLENKTKFCVGAFVEWLENSSLSLLTEVYYIQKGGIDKQVRTGESGPEPIGTLKWDYRVDYISIPVLAKYSLRLAHSAFTVAAGPRADIRLYQKNELLDYGVSDPAMDEIYTDFKRVDVGADFSIGFEKSIASSVDLLVEFRYSPDFTNVYRSDFLRIKNDSYEVLFGFRL